MKEQTNNAGWYGLLAVHGGQETKAILKPLACASPLTETIDGVQHRVHDGFVVWGDEQLPTTKVVAEFQHAHVVKARTSK